MIVQDTDIAQMENVNVINSMVVLNVKLLMLVQERHALAMELVVEINVYVNQDGLVLNVMNKLEIVLINQPVVLIGKAKDIVLKPMFLI